MAAKGPKIPSRDRDFPKKKPPGFLKLLGPVTPLWVLQPSQIVHMVSTESLAARAVFSKSIKMLGWQVGAPKFREHDFPKKKSCFFEIHRTSDRLWVLQPSQIMHLVSTESLLARAVFTKKIKVIGWQPGAPKSREHDFPKKNFLFLNFIGPVTPPWVLYPSETMHMVFTESLLASAVFARSIKVLGWQPVAPKLREHDFPKKKLLIF